MGTYWFAALALAAALSPAAAENFETTAAQALSDSGVVAQSRQAGAKVSADSADMGRVLLERGDHQRGGDHSGDCCRDRGHGHDHDRGGGDHDGWHDHDRWGDHDRWHHHDEDHDRPLPPLNPTPGHWNPRPLPQPPRTGWARWSGHPGWGYQHGWQWRQEYPIWWGWTPFVVVPGATHYQCLSYYGGLDGACQSYCLSDNNTCLQDCSVYAPGDVECTTACGTSFNFCRYQCDSDRDARSATCP